ncbi:amino acid adenylation domain-containing protein [Paenibacillus sp. HN-1]|uniref:non-ribosomal peptide synthetase n=1 Tax=Paenibacillus TaxID=44249 RepID=UPI001CA9DC75|nr:MULTISPECIES: amino acid adenylation domain-containing protein [Paenibacillus]MBY9077393.1 amino acid adenylation domain-containing protein [Paenibacillus sp. CGMCC 1.18879]MBY9087499.1 amino acid adenylation domain-containing protein [Paenibacillus sinensis]
MKKADTDNLEPIVLGLNDTDADYDKSVTLHELFQQQARKYPDAIALIFQGKTMSYRELDEKSNSLAWLLRSKGVGIDDVVGIMATRSFEMIIGIFAVLKAGGAYMPVNPQNPVKRNEFMLTESKSKVLLVQTLDESDVAFTGEKLSLDDQRLYGINLNPLPVINESSDLAYVIYTSGSTGHPKGVMIEHRSVLNRLVWMQDKYPLYEEDTLLQKTSYSFDVSVWEIFWWFFAGAKLCILEPGMEKFPQGIIECCCNNQVTVIHFVPSMLNMFLNYLKGSNEEGRLSSLKQVFVSGEALTPQQVMLFNKQLYSVNATKLINLYGPTEATIDVTYYDCPSSGDIHKVFIGKPIYNTKILIVSDGHIQPVGQAGEIYILGDGLARGYLHREDLTNTHFVKSLLPEYSRMYKTGDIGRWHPDGNLEYLGREDFQVKIRGLRIELMEIEAALESFSSVKQSVVIVNKVSETIINLCAFIVSETDIPVSQLKSHIKGLLPDYMVPNKYFVIEEMPLTANGKVDRKLLQSTYL